MKLHIDSDRIQKQIEIKAPRTRAWRALTDYREFSAWFGVNLESPFVAGQSAAGQITYPGYEHVRMDVRVQKIEPESYFAFTWHPYAIDPKVDYFHETPTLVEFILEDAPAGTKLTVVESGFAKLPPNRRDEAFRMNEDGWSEQLNNIVQYASQK